MAGNHVTAPGCIYGLICLAVYISLSLFPFLHKCRLRLRGTAAVCMVWAMAEGAVALFLREMGLGLWSLLLHWTVGIPFMLLLIREGWEHVMFAQFFLYGQMAGLTAIRQWLEQEYFGLLVFLTVFYFLGAGLVCKKLLIPILSVRMTGGMKSWILFWMVPYVVFLLICTSCYLWENGGGAGSGLLSAYIILTNIFFLFIYQIMKSVLLENEESLRRESERKNMALIARQYEEVLERQESVRRLRHDMRHFFRAMNEMAREQDLDGIRNYLYQYGESLDRILPPHMAPICQNPVINGMASYYLSQARSEGIEVRADCELKGQLPVSDLELSGMVGNLLENALEACRRMEGGKPFIHMVLKSQGNGILVLMVENSYQGQVRTKDRHFLSSKREALGIGLSSVCDAAERAGGTVKIHYDGGIFRVSVMLAMTAEE